MKGLNYILDSKLEFLDSILDTRSLVTLTLKTLVVSLVLTWLDYGNATLAGIQSNLLCRLQSMLNASARTITDLPRSAHITASLAGLHWLHAAERIKFKLATLTYRCLHCTALHYMSAQLTRVTGIPSRRRLRSSVTDALLVRPTQLVTVVDRAFPVDAAKLWNELPVDVTASVSLTDFHRQLETFLFHVSYPDSFCTAIAVFALTLSKCRMKWTKEEDLSIKTQKLKRRNTGV